MSIELYFCHWSREKALNFVDLYGKEFSGRIFPEFENIDEKADKAAEEFYAAARSCMAPEDCDGYYSFAEAAQEHGFEVHENLLFVQQQAFGLACAGLYHLWERTIKQLIYKELRRWEPPPIDFNQLKSANFGELEKFFADFGFHFKNEPFYSSMNQLRLVASVIKHGDGKACNQLEIESPQLFKYGVYKFDISSVADNLMLSSSDFRCYEQAVREFWTVFPERLIYRY